MSCKEVDLHLSGTLASPEEFPKHSHGVLPERLSPHCLNEPLTRTVSIPGVMRISLQLLVFGNEDSEDNLASCVPFTKGGDQGRTAHYIRYAAWSPQTLWLWGVCYCTSGPEPCTDCHILHNKGMTREWPDLSGVP